MHLSYGHLMSAKIKFGFGAINSLWQKYFVQLYIYPHLLSFEEGDVEDGGIKIDKLETENFER